MTIVITIFLLIFYNCAIFQINEKMNCIPFKVVFYDHPQQR